MKKDKLKICVLTGAGMSAESGIKTFRDEDGLWEGHDVMQVATPEGWVADMELVLDFYNQRRCQLLSVQPNIGHKEIALLEKDYDIAVITQNVDDLHERSGSSKVIHLHGELLKVRSTGDARYIIEWDKDLRKDDLCPAGYQLRPHIVWFGEAVPMLDAAINELKNADIVMVIGTSMQVYPAASLTSFAPPQAPILYIDPNPSINHELSRARKLKIFKGKASTEIKKAIEYIRSYRL
jgi:NAD-dependent deacetylase